MNNKESSTNKVYAPQLRFPGFTGEWEKRTGGQLFSQVINKKHNSNLPILAITQERGAIPRSEIDYHVSVTSESVNGYKVVEVGDFIISLRSFQGGIEYSRYKGICSPAYVILRAVGDVCTSYFQYYFKSAGFIKDLTKNLEGLRDGKMISYKQFSEVPIPLPPTFPEQTRIAAALSSLDAVIAAHQNKQEVLQEHKRGLMAGLFPGEGKRVPQLRFPEFERAGEWEEKKLKEVLTERARPIKMDDDKIYSLVTVKRKYGGVVKREDNYGKNILVKSQFLIEANDFLISKRQIVHSACGVVPEELSGSIVSNEYSVMRTNEGYSVKFFEYFSQQPVISRSFVLSSNGIVIEKMLFNLEDWLNRSFLFPSLSEQKSIAALLSSLDDLIAAQSDNITALQTFKRGLIHGLFPKNGEE